MLEVLSARSVSPRLWQLLHRHLPLMQTRGGIKAPGASPLMVPRAGGKAVKHLARCDQGSRWAPGAMGTSWGGREDREHSSGCDTPGHLLCCNLSQAHSLNLFHPCWGGTKWSQHPPAPLLHLSLPPSHPRLLHPSARRFKSISCMFALVFAAPQACLAWQGAAQHPGAHPCLPRVCSSPNTGTPGPRSCFLHGLSPVVHGGREGGKEAVVGG